MVQATYGIGPCLIPSTLNGSCFNPDTGKVDPEQLKKNMDLATDVYINRVNNAPCGKNCSKEQIAPLIKIYVRMFSYS